MNKLTWIANRTRPPCESIEVLILLYNGDTLLGDYLHDKGVFVANDLTVNDVEYWLEVIKPINCFDPWEMPAAIDYDSVEKHFTGRASNCLKLAQINNIKELRGCTECELKATPNLGKNTLLEIKDFFYQKRLHAMTTRGMF